jgi:hypothetical protein
MPPFSGQKGKSSVEKNGVILGRGRNHMGTLGKPTGTRKTVQILFAF